MNKIHIRFVLFQLLFSFISLLLFNIIALDFSGSTPMKDCLYSGVTNLALFGGPIIASIFYNLIHISNLNRLECSDESIAGIVILTVIALLLICFYCFINWFIDCNWELQISILGINTILFIPQIILMHLRDKKIPTIEGQMQIQRNRDKGYKNFSKNS